MKKLLSLVLVLTAIVTANAQPCTPNPQYVDSTAGIWPEALPSICKNYAFFYNLVFDIKTLTDTCINSPSQVCLWVQSMAIVSSSLPAGFTLTPDVIPWTNGGSPPNLTPIQGCARLDADQAALVPLYGDYNISISVDLLVKNQDPNSPLLQDWTWSSTLGTLFTFNYTLAIYDCVGIDELQTDRFSVAPNFPNPFTGTTTISFNTVRDEACTIKVYNMLGALVYETKFQSKAGKNMYIMDAAKLQSGMYMFTMSNGKETVTRKMTVQN